MAAPAQNNHGIKASPWIPNITDNIYQEFLTTIDTAISSHDFSDIEKTVKNYNALFDVAPNHLEHLQKQGSFYSVLCKHVSQAQYDSVVSFLDALQEHENSECFISDDIFLCHVACLLAIDAAGWHDKCAGMIQDRILKSPDLHQHFDTLMLSDHRYTEFYRPIAGLFSAV